MALDANVRRCATPFQRALLVIDFERERAGLRLIGKARDAECVTLLPELIDACELQGESIGECRAWRDERIWWKCEAFRASSSRRHKLRASWMGRPYPRVAEFENLEWLRANGFDAPEPLLAAVGIEHGRPRWQLLATRFVPDCRDLRSLLEAPRAPTDASLDLHRLLESLGVQVAAMHALGFVHRDLFPRNLLIRQEPAGPRLFFLDAWRGGARPQLRGAAYDLACLFLHLPEWLEREQIAELFAAYLKRRFQSDSPVSVPKLVRRIERCRRGLIRRLAAEPARLRGLPLPDPAWRMPVSG